MIIEFNDDKSSAVKLISVKNKSVIKCTQDLCQENF